MFKMKPTNLPDTSTCSSSGPSISRPVVTSGGIGGQWSQEIISILEEEVAEEVNEEEEVRKTLQSLSRTVLRPYRWHKATSQWQQDEPRDDEDYAHVGDDPAVSGSGSSSGAPNGQGNGKTLRMKRIAFVSYNVWFGTRRESKEELRPRFEALFKIVEEKNPDVVCFQEMTSNIISLLMEQPWVRENYWISDTDRASTFLGYGVLIFSRLPYKRLTLQELPTNLGRKVLILELNINNQTFAVATSHLESYTKDGPTRAKQLRIIYHLLQESNYDHAVLMGDFNFVDSAERERSIHQDYRDQWLTVHGPNNPGYTYDMKKNLMLKRMERAKKRRVRIDLILSRAKNSAWRPSHVELLGTQPINSDPIQWPQGEESDSESSDSDSDGEGSDAPSTENLIYPSDHFGLYGTLDFVE